MDDKNTIHIYRDVDISLSCSTADLCSILCSSWQQKMKESEFHSETYFVFELIGESHSADLTQVNIDFSPKSFAPYFKGFEDLLSINI